MDFIFLKGNTAIELLSQAKIWIFGSDLTLFSVII